MEDPRTSPTERRIDRLAHVLPPTARTNAAGHLEIGGCDTVELATRFGTPLYVYDAAALRERCQDYKAAFESRFDAATVLYAAKAFTCLAMVELVAGEGLGMDVASAGELAVALKGGMPASRIVLHGNNKTDAEIDAAITAGVGRIVIDSLDEIAQLNARAAVSGADSVDVLVRITPGIEADTHANISTGGLDSKFGLGLASGEAEEAVRRITAAKRLRLCGVHCHIGSQILTVDEFAAAAAVAVGFLATQPGFDSTDAEVDVGGGLGIAYTAADTAPSVAGYAAALHSAIAEAAAKYGIGMPAVLVEPGRSLAGRAGITLYTVGTIKRVRGGRTHVAVDGGMSDNLRPAMYAAPYEALLASRPDAAPTIVADVVGKHCERGDVLVPDARLPADVAAGDILATPATGAYAHSLASNYNMSCRPAVVFVEDASARVVVEREAIEDLMARMR
jgi:diaminopimelate decarboxylase